MFKTFPAFTKLTLTHREEYEALIKDYPPLSDISFGSLMLWWDYVGEVAVAHLNGNIVLSYWIPGDDEHSGLALVGTQDVDQSVCAIFDYMHDRNEKPRLVNVPDFTVHSMRYPELFTFQTGTGDDEYLLSIVRFANLDAPPPYTRFRVRKFMREFRDNSVRVERLNLHSLKVRRTVIEAASAWPRKGINNINKFECETLPLAVSHAPAVGMRGVGLFIDGLLQAYCLYLPTADRDYIISSHVRVNYDVPRSFDYMVYAFSCYLQDEGHKFINIHADNGSQKMRALKLALKPDNFFRKYTIEPATVPTKQRYDIFKEP